MGMLHSGQQPDDPMYQSLLRRTTYSEPRMMTDSTIPVLSIMGTLMIGDYCRCANATEDAGDKLTLFYAADARKGVS